MSGRRGRSLAVTLVGAAALLAQSSAVAADEACCFTNPRYAGPCAVTPGTGETCASVLAYLNGLAGGGRAYCASTDVRGGWKQVPCAPGGGAVVDSLDTLRARPAEMYSAPGWGEQLSSGAFPSPEPVVVAPASVIKVSMDEPVDLARTPPGTSFAAHLEADLVVSGEVAAASGSAVYGRVVQAQGQAQPVLELTDITVDGRLVPVVADATTRAAVALPVASGAHLLGKGEVVAADPVVALLQTGDVAGAMELTRATIRARRQEIVAASMSLSADEANAFWPLYLQYRAAQDALAARDAKLILDYSETWESLTDEKARALLDEAVAVEGERAKLRQQYVKRFAKVLPGVKLARFFQVESKLDTVIRMELAAGIPLAR